MQTAQIAQAPTNTYIVTAGPDAVELFEPHVIAVTKDYAARLIERGFTLSMR